MSNILVILTGKVDTDLIDISEFVSEGLNIKGYGHHFTIRDSEATKKIEINLNDIEINQEFMNSDLYKEIRDNHLLIYENKFEIAGTLQYNVEDTDKILEILKLVRHDENLYKQRFKAAEIQKKINKQIKMKNLKPVRKGKQKVKVLTKRQVEYILSNPTGVSDNVPAKYLPTEYLSRFPDGIRIGFDGKRAQTQQD